MRPLPHVLLAGALAVGLTACGFSVDGGEATGGDEPTAAPDDGGDEQDGDSADDTSMPADEDAQHDGSISQAEAEAVATAYLGLTEAEAEAQAEVDDRPFRVGARDGEQFMLTEDYVLGRITVTIEDGVITSATVEATETPVTVDALDS